MHPITLIPIKVYTTFSDKGRFLAFWQSTDLKMVCIYPLRQWPNGIAKIPYGSWHSRTPPPANTIRELTEEEIIKSVKTILDRNQIYIYPQNVEVSRHTPGAYHPRIWRGVYNRYLFDSYCPIEPEKIYGAIYFQSVTSATSLFLSMTDLFRYVEPSACNLNAYGHRLRELLILAGTEIEACWRGILLKNKVVKSDRLNTSEYHVLKKPLRLDEWQVSLKDYPDLTPLTPFKYWSQEAPTKSLPWYDAYNAVKHNREGEFKESNLANVITAMSALFILQAAQWGPQIFDPLHGSRVGPFTLDETPRFNSSDIYLPPVTEEKTYAPARYFNE